MGTRIWQDTKNIKQTGEPTDMEPASVHRRVTNRTPDVSGSASMGSWGVRHLATVPSEPSSDKSVIHACFHRVCGGGGDISLAGSMHTVLQSVT